jgi:pimeloyl-ACP methyl ester carboxylesterase
MQAVISELLTTYEITGKGDDLLLLHGWGDDHHTFDKLSKELIEKYRVISFDLPGFGASQAPQSVWGLNEYAEFTQSFCEKIRVNPKAIIAHSNGGSVAIKAVSNGLLNTEKLLLIASAGIRDRQKARRIGIKLIAKIGKVLTFWLPKHHKRKLQKKLYGAAGSDMLVNPHLQETFKKTVRQDIQADAAKINIPTLLLYGSEDKATPPLYGEIFHKLIKNSKLQIVEGATHFIHQEKPQAVAQYIKDFLHEN